MLRKQEFDAFNKKISYTWRIKQLGYTVAMMFLRAYEKGETIYMSMQVGDFQMNLDSTITKAKWVQANTFS